MSQDVGSRKPSMVGCCGKVSSGSGRLQGAFLPDVSSADQPIRGCDRSSRKGMGPWMCVGVRGC